MISKFWCRSIHSPAMSFWNSALSRPRGALTSISSTTAFCRSFAKRKRFTSRLFSRSVASRSTNRANRSSKASAVMSGCRCCSSNAFAMPVSPSVTRRFRVGCVSIVYLLSSVVVTIAADVAVMDRWCLGRLVVGVGAIEPMRQDRLDRAVARGADVVAASAGCFDAGRAVAAREPQDAESGAEALLGMRLGLHDGFDERDGGGTDLAGFPHHSSGRPFSVAPMRARHVLRGCRVAMAY